MAYLRFVLVAVALVGPLAAEVAAQQHHPHPHPSAGPPPAVAAYAAGGVTGGYLRPGATNGYIPSYLLGNPGVDYRAATSAHIPGGPGIAFPYVGPAPSAVGGIANRSGPGGLMLPPAAPDAPATEPRSPSSAASPRTRSGRVDELVEMGDRSFRNGNYRRAEERYQQALRSQSESPDPYVRLAQIAIIRGDYTRASAHLRDAVAGSTSAGWLLGGRDIRVIFGEPSDFARQIAHLESHLQAHPQDRNAWFVLGAEQHLAGRHQQARDAFLRLTDRPADPALAAFLDATTIAQRTETPHETASASVR